LIRELVHVHKQLNNELPKKKKKDDELEGEQKPLEHSDTVMRIAASLAEDSTQVQAEQIALEERQKNQQEAEDLLFREAIAQNKVKTEPSGENEENNEEGEVQEEEAKLEESSSAPTKKKKKIKKKKKGEAENSKKKKLVKKTKSFSATPDKLLLDSIQNFLGKKEKEGR